MYCTAHFPVPLTVGPVIENKLDFTVRWSLEFTTTVLKFKSVIFLKTFSFLRERMNSDSESDWDSMSEAPNPPKQSAVDHKASNGFKQNGHVHQEENGRLDSHLRHELDNGLKAMPSKRTLGMHES